MTDIDEQTLPVGMERPSLETKMMWLAIEEARRAAVEDEVPVGAVVAIDDQVIASAHNERERTNNPLAHAEMLAIVRAAKTLKRWRLNDATLYVTLEPCPMCAGAIVNARIGQVVFGAQDPKAGAVRTLFRLADDLRLNHRAAIKGGIMREECAVMLKEFFRTKRG